MISGIQELLVFLVFFQEKLQFLGSILGQSASLESEKNPCAIPSLKPSPINTLSHETKTSIALDALPVIRQPRTMKNPCVFPSPNPSPIRRLSHLAKTSIAWKRFPSSADSSACRNQKPTYKDIDPITVESPLDTCPAVQPHQSWV